MALSRHSRLFGSLTGWYARSSGADLSRGSGSRPWLLPLSLGDCFGTGVRFNLAPAWRSSAVETNPTWAKAGSRTGLLALSLLSLVTFDSGLSSFWAAPQLAAGCAFCSPGSGATPESRTVGDWSFRLGIALQQPCIGVSKDTCYRRASFRQQASLLLWKPPSKPKWPLHPTQRRFGSPMWDAWADTERENPAFRLYNRGVCPYIHMCVCVCVSCSLKFLCANQDLSHGGKPFITEFSEAKLISVTTQSSQKVFEDHLHDPRWLDFFANRQHRAKE